MFNYLVLKPSSEIVISAEVNGTIINYMIACKALLISPRILTHQMTKQAKKINVQSWTIELAMSVLCNVIIQN